MGCLMAVGGLPPPQYLALVGHLPCLRRLGAFSPLAVGLPLQSCLSFSTVTWQKCPHRWQTANFECLLDVPCVMSCEQVDAELGTSCVAPRGMACRLQNASAER